MDRKKAKRLVKLTPVVLPEGIENDEPLLAAQKAIDATKEQIIWGIDDRFDEKLTS